MNMKAITLQTIVLALVVWSAASLAQDSTDTSPSAGLQPADSVPVRLTETVTLSDTIPRDFFADCG